MTLNPRGWWNYARAIARGSRQGKIVEPNQIPGLAVLDANANAIWIHRGKGLGDYPALNEVLEDFRKPHPPRRSRAGMLKAPRRRPCQMVDAELPAAERELTLLIGDCWAVCEPCSRGALWRLPRTAEGTAEPEVTSTDSPDDHRGPRQVTRIGCR